MLNSSRSQSFQAGLLHVGFSGACLKEDPAEKEFSWPSVLGGNGWVGRGAQGRGCGLEFGE